MAFMGSIYSLFGNCEILSQISIMMAPFIATAGIKVLWFEVVNNNFAMCGTAKPINAIGPAKAVMTPVKILVAIKVIFLVFFTLIPKLLA